MKYFFSILCNVLFIGVRAGSADSCVLTGDIRGLANHRIIFSYSSNDTTFHSDTIRARHGHFVLSRHLDEPTYFHITTLRDHPKKHSKRYGYALYYIGRNGRRFGTFRSVLLENRSMTWSASLKKFNRSPIGNAPLNDTLMAIDNISTRIWKRDTILHKLNRRIHLTAQQLALRGDLNQALFLRQQDSIAAYIIAHPHSYASANSLWRIMYPADSIKRAAYDALDPAFRHLANVSSFKKKLDKIMGHVLRGDMAPEITLADTSGHDVALSSYRGHVTLVDFWASWCRPCREENPNVLKAYKKYHGKGFDIYAVSLDGNKIDWAQAIRKDQLPWTHVSDLKYFDSKAALAFGVHGIPDNFLLDKDGKVIARNLRGRALDAKLKEVLK